MDASTKKETEAGVWMAYYRGADGGPGVPFATEIEAYRYALPLSMHVTFAVFGDEDWMNR